MSTLIVPCAGRNFIDGKPKYITRHPDGQLLAVKSISGLDLSQYERILFVLLQEDVDRYHADEILKQELGFVAHVELIILPKQTSGPADTIYQAIKTACVEGAFVVKDLDVRLEIKDIQEDSNFVVGMDVQDFPHDIHKLKDKSFIIVNEQNNVLDVVEKHLCSDIISVGMYGFARVSDFVKAYERLIDDNYGLKMLYCSHIISYLIGYNRRLFSYVEAVDFESWGTKADWYDILRAHGQTVATDMKKDKLAIFDLDGTLFDTREVNYLSYAEAVEGYGEIDKEYFYEYCNGRHYLDFLPQIVGNDEVILTDIHEKKKASYSKYLSKATKNTSLFDIMKSLSRDYQIALVTTASEKNTREILDAFEETDSFDLILTREQVTKSKPDPEGFLLAMKLAGVNPEDTLIFEDSPVGLEAAKASGANFVQVHGFN